MDANTILARLQECSIPADEALAGKLQIYFELLNDWNTKIDLTAILEESEMLDRHFVDSLIVLNHSELLNGAKTLIDVGTGAGFPGLPLAMAIPSLHVTLLDAQQKRLNFLQQVINATGLQNVELIHTRAEDGARLPKLRDFFDLAIARAVAPLNVLAEYLLPYVAVGGRAICWKGPALDEEMVSGKKAAFLCGGKLLDAIPVSIPGRDWRHRLVLIEKNRATPSVYPRKAGTPSKKPLGI